MKKKEKKKGFLSKSIGKKGGSFLVVSKKHSAPSLKKNSKSTDDIHTSVWSKKTVSFDSLHEIGNTSTVGSLSPLGRRSAMGLFDEVDPSNSPDSSGKVTFGVTPDASSLPPLILPDSLPVPPENDDSDEDGWITPETILESTDIVDSTTETSNIETNVDLIVDKETVEAAECLKETLNQNHDESGIKQFQETNSLSHQLITLSKMSTENSTEEDAKQKDKIQLQGQALTPAVRRLTVLAKRKSDSAQALGLYEKFFTVEVNLPDELGGGVTASMFPTSYTVDQVKTKVISKLLNLQTRSPQDYHLGLDQNKRFTVEFVVFLKADPYLFKSWEQKQTIKVGLYHVSSIKYDANNFRDRTMTLQSVDIKQKLQLYGGKASYPLSKSIDSAPAATTPIRLKEPPSPDISQLPESVPEEPQESPAEEYPLQPNPLGFSWTKVVKPSLETTSRRATANPTSNTSSVVAPKNIKMGVYNSPMITETPGYSIEPLIEGNDIPPNDFLISFRNEDLCVYNEYFYGKHHKICVGRHNSLGHVIVTILKKPELKDLQHSKDGSVIYRTAIWTRNGVQDVFVSINKKSAQYSKFGMKGGKSKVGLGLKSGAISSQTILKELKKLDGYKFLDEMNFEFPKEFSKLAEELLEMELGQVVTTYKFGILYATDGQTKEEDMFSNVEESQEYSDFLNFLGTKIDLKGWQEYRGGLDVKTDSTGKHSLYTTWKEREIMFHVSTYLPYSKADRQQLERKRHLGNDIVVLVYKEGTAPYAPDTISSEFNHVFIVVQPSGNGKYQVQCVSKEGVGHFAPSTLACGFETNSLFREYLLSKLINAERAAYDAPSFAEKIKRTRAMQLKVLVEKYSSQKS